VFDLAVYGTNKSLRLPLCGKITKNVFIDKRMVPLTRSELKDFFISNASDVIQHVPSNILLDKRIAVDLPFTAMNVSRMEAQLFEQFLAQNTPTMQWHVNE
jgi:hypothetical protein